MQKELGKLNHVKALSSLQRSFSKSKILEYRSCIAFSRDCPSESAIIASRMQFSIITRISGRLLPRALKIFIIINE